MVDDVQARIEALKIVIQLMPHMSENGRPVQLDMPRVLGMAEMIATWYRDGKLRV